MKKDNQNSQIVIYKDQKGKIKIDVRFEDETVWLTQAQIAQLFGKGRSTITEHIQNIFEERELEEKLVVSILENTTEHGAIESKTQTKSVKYYNLKAITSYDCHPPGGLVNLK